ncbi:Glycylpeptide N-tetradecanoyltransferase 2 [Nymphon striatum]|nr:Glycylpeptide N-tetradecanoyltransferase 2 [Nymphon striatum]
MAENKDTEFNPELPKDETTELPKTDKDSKRALAKKNKKKKKNKSRNVENGDVVDGVDGDMTLASALKNVENLTGQGAIPPGQIEEFKKAFEKLNLNTPAKTQEDAMKKHYQFWDTQPVPKLTEEVTSNESIDSTKTVDDIRKEPYTLPPGFNWDTLDLDNPMTLKELYNLLSENYVEDDDNMFRFDYSPEFLKWALQPPGWKQEWHCGVRVTKNNKLMGFISAVPVHMRIYEKFVKMVEINFLCVHKKLRSKRVAPVLIREITRRVNLEEIFQAVYTAGIVIPKPVGCCRYWHRSLNPRKLIEVKFSHLSRNMTMQRTLKLYKLPDQTKTAGFRRMDARDISQAFTLLENYFKKFDLSPIFTEDEFKHWFIGKPNIVDSFVVENDGVVTDMVSFYTLPSSIMDHPVHKMLKAAYSFYNVSTKTPLVDLMTDALIVAKNNNFDVFNALDLMDNQEFLEPLKFGIGDGNLQYYLYNWRCPVMPPNKVNIEL